MTMQENVAAGAALLDEHIPNWFELIDLETLEMEHGCNCIRGQLEDYIDPELVDRIISHSEDSSLLYPIELGFSINTFVDSWSELRMEWIRQIYIRKENG